MIPRITNICLSFNCDCRLNLISISREIKTSSYKPKKFSGLILRLEKSKSTALIFSSGYISISGLKNFKHLIKSTYECLKLIKKCSKFKRISNFKVYNICGAVNVNPINLTLLAKSFPRVASYETELFPALKFNFQNKIFTVHRSGAIFSTGFKSRNQLNLLFLKFIELIKLFIEENGGSKEKK
jgi:transcription initiation factor TFIID TATA-box-binding protein